LDQIKQKCLYIFQRFRSLTNFGRSSIASTPCKTKFIKTMFFYFHLIEYIHEDNIHFPLYDDLVERDNNLDHLSLNFSVRISTQTNQKFINTTVIFHKTNFAIEKIPISHIENRCCDQKKWCSCYNK